MPMFMLYYVIFGYNILGKMMFLNYMKYKSLWQARHMKDIWKVLRQGNVNIIAIATLKRRLWQLVALLQVMNLWNTHYICYPLYQRCIFSYNSNILLVLYHLFFSPTIMFLLIIWKINIIHPDYTFQSFKVHPSPRFYPL